MHPALQPNNLEYALRRPVPQSMSMPGQRHAQESASIPPPPEQTRRNGESRPRPQQPTPVWSTQRARRPLPSLAPLDRAPGSRLSPHPLPPRHRIPTKCTTHHRKVFLLRHRLDDVFARRHNMRVRNFSVQVSSPLARWRWAPETVAPRAQPGPEEGAPGAGGGDSDSSIGSLSNGVDRGEDQIGNEEEMVNRE